jgi:superfamily II DNA/RNA helicase
VAAKIAQYTKIKVALGDHETQFQAAHLVVTTPGFIKSKLGERNVTLDLSALRVIVYDEADEILNQDTNWNCLQVLKKHISSLKVKPQ